MSNQLKLGFVGLGIMGAPMAGQLVKAGHEVFVYTRSKVAAEIAQSSAIQCTSAAEVAQKADIIFTMVPDTPDVEKVLFGENGVASGLSKGKVLVDMSSISPIATKEFAKKINALGCDYLDAPVSGGEVGAKNATLSIMVGGDEKVFEKIKPIFELMGKNRIELHQKDLNLALNSARALGVSLPNTATAQELFNSCAAHGGKAWDHSAMVKALEMMANFEIGQKS